MKSTKLLIKDLNEIMSTYQVNEYRVEKVNFGGEFVISFLLFNYMNELERNWQKLNGIFSEYLEEYIVDDFKNSKVLEEKNFSPFVYKILEELKDFKCEIVKVDFEFQPKANYYLKILK